MEVKRAVEAATEHGQGLVGRQHTQIAVVRDEVSRPVEQVVEQNEGESHPVDRQRTEVERQHILEQTAKPRARAGPHNARLCIPLAGRMLISTSPSAIH